MIEKYRHSLLREFHLEKVKKIDFEIVKLKNQKRYKSFSKQDTCEAYELLDDEIIVDQLSSCLWEQKDLNKIDVEELFLIIISLITQLNSLSASYQLGYWGKLIAEENVSKTLRIAMKTWESSDNFTKLLLRPFILEFFDYDCSLDYKYLSKLNEVEINFLQTLWNESSLTSSGETLPRVD